MATRKRSGISGDRAYRIQKKYAEKIKDIYSRAVSYKSPHETTSELLSSEVWRSPELKKAPSYVRSYLQGMNDCKFDEIYRHHLAWMLSLDGKLMTRKQVDEQAALEKEMALDRNPSYRSPWQRIDSDSSRHVWLDSKGNPLPDKPYDARHTSTNRSR